MPAAALGDLLVATFAGYRYPPAPDPTAAMVERLATEALDLEASVVALDDRDRAVGLSLLAVRGEDSWCGGFGLVPRVRGRRLASAMMREQVARAAEAGARRMRLEVLEGNEPARRAYLAVGFRHVRDVGLWRRQGRARAGPPLAEAEPARAAQALAALAGTRHTWQREPATLELVAARPGVRGGVWADAAAMWRPASWGGTQLLSVSAADREAASRALSAMAASLDHPLTLFNEPYDTAVDAVLAERGFISYDSQHELELDPLP
jgi:GNAT superfamily N-acetyltransferase